MTDQSVRNAGEESGKKRPGALRSIRVAFSSWWSVLGMVAASVTGFDLARRLVPHFHPAALIAEGVRYYQSLVHIPVLSLFGWLHWPKPPTWTIDAVVLWVLIGGVVFRTTLARRSAAHEHGILPTFIPKWNDKTESIDWAVKRSHVPWQLILLNRSPVPMLLSCMVLWPFIGFAVLRMPHVYRLQWKNGLTQINCIDVPPRPGDPRYLFDTRIVFIVQAATMVLCIAAWFTLNGALALYADSH